MKERDFLKLLPEDINQNTKAKCYFDLCTKVKYAGSQQIDRQLYKGFIPAPTNNSMYGQVFFRKFSLSIKN